MRDLWIDCQVVQGPMAHEFVVTVQGIDRTHEVWVAKPDVKIEEKARAGTPSAGKLLVRGVDACEGRQLVELPGEVASGTRLIWVKEAAIAA